MSRNNKSGFSLVELMISVAIVAMIASVAGPAFSSYVMRSRSSEVPMQLGEIYKGLSTYWSRAYQEGQGVGATSASNCIVTDAMYTASWVDTSSKSAYVTTSCTVSRATARSPTAWPPLVTHAARAAHRAS